VGFKAGWFVSGTSETQYFVHLPNNIIDSSISVADSWNYATDYSHNILIKID